MLSYLGYKPTLSHTPLQALELIRQHDFKVILSDFRMPGMNGQQFYEKILAEKPGLARRVIFLSGDTVNSDSVSFMETTGNLRLPKPFQLTQVDEAIKKVLAGAQPESATQTTSAPRQPGNNN
jgi:CheY-like chemotaxis protein